MRRFLVSLFSLLLASLAAPAAGQDREVPYWATLRFDEVRMRVGPSEEFPIAWVYQRKGLPVKVVRLREAWRLVEDPEGERGWIAQSQLDPARGAIVTGKGLTEMRAEPSRGAQLLWRVEPGVVGKLGDCEDGWCRFDVSGRKGWIRANRLWGAGEP